MMKLPYKEGTWFAIPLRQGGYIPGIVARHVPDEGKIMLAYLFGPKREVIPTLDELGGLAPDSAIKVARVGDLGIIEGTWPIIGDTPNWEREKWPIPPFVRKDDLGKTACRVVYADDDPNQVISEERIPYESSGYERDSLLGAGAAEVAVSRLVS